MLLRTAPKIRLVSWNIAHTAEAWRVLARDETLDIALLQEPVQPAAGLVKETIPGDGQSWGTAGNSIDFCAAIARVSDRVRLHPIETVPLGERLKREQLGVSRMGTLAAADVEFEDDERITVVSMYGRWEEPREGSWIYADASVHRIISDLSVLIGRQRGHSIIAAGDLNILYGHAEGGSPYWRERYMSVFTRMEALGLSFVGPQHPHGQQADPWPEELPKDSKNVPTFRPRRSNPRSATRQLDFVFASARLKERLEVRAMNAPEEWGPSDHCRVAIELS